MCAYGALVTSILMVMELWHIVRKIASCLPNVHIATYHSHVRLVDQLL
jgi:hypothetical protein